MNVGLWITAGLIAALLIFAFKGMAIFSRKGHLMSYYAMALLLDETTYRKKQAEFFDLLKSLKVESPLALYGALRDEMEKSAPAPKWVITRIWQVRTGTIRAPETIKPEVPEKIGHAVGKIADPHPDRDKNVAENNRLARFAIAIWKIKRRILGD